MCTMPRDKGAEMTKTDRDYRRELEYLYARRSAIEALIASLQQYELYRDGASYGELKQA